MILNRPFVWNTTRMEYCCCDMHKPTIDGYMVQKQFLNQLWYYFGYYKKILGISSIIVYKAQESTRMRENILIFMYMWYTLIQQQK